LAANRVERIAEIDLYENGRGVVAVALGPLAGRLEANFRAKWLANADLQRDEERESVVPVSLAEALCCEAA